MERDNDKPIERRNPTKRDTIAYPMKTETRANLIFIIIFLAVALPGAVILFIKKLDPAAAPMYLPDPIHQRLPYMAPQWTPDEVVRVIPPVTGTWVEQLTGEQGAGSGVMLHERLPLISEDRMVQVTAIKYTPARLTVYAILWDGEDGLDAAGYQTAISSAGTAIPGHVVAVRKISMPDGVRKELMNGGYVAPRQWVAWLELQFDQPMPEPSSFALHLSYKNGEISSDRSVNLFTQ